MEKSLRQIFNAHKKTHWLHEYAEDGIVNFNDLQKIVKEHKSNQVQAVVSVKTANGLLPCPFCSKIPRVASCKNYNASTTHREIYDYWVKCENDECPIRPSTGTTWQEDYAKQSWNNRK